MVLLTFAASILGFPKTPASGAASIHATGPARSRRNTGFFGALTFSAALAATSAVRADDAPTCEPACGEGSICHAGACVAEPCKSSMRCERALLGARENTRVASQGETLADERRTSSETPPIERERPRKYRPSFARFYAGPMMNVFGGGLVRAGGTLAFDFHVDRARVFFVGVRGSFWGDDQAVAVLVDLDIGFRPRLYATRDVAVALSLGGGLGFATLVASGGVSVPFAHLPIRVGPSFDLGAFTFEVLAGPAVYSAQASAVGFEGLVELGARFR